MKNITLSKTTPWPGLASYNEESQAWFKGRNSESKELFQLVKREELTILFGRSGLGKTSLLQAGLFPKLRSADYLPIRIHLMLSDEASSFEQQILDALIKECIRREVTYPKPKNNETLWEYFHRVDSEYWSIDDKLLTPVLVFDQFEEIFTLGRVDLQKRKACDQLLETLGDIIESRQPHTSSETKTSYSKNYDVYQKPPKMLFSFREDYLPDFDIMHKYTKARTSNRLRLLPMNGQQAFDAIISASGTFISTETGEIIIRFIDSRSLPLSELLIEPALLSLLCTRLNEQRIHNKKETIATSALEKGDATEILESFYTDAFRGVTREAQYFVEDHLITASGYRDSCAVDNALSHTGVTQKVIDQLIDRKLLRGEKRGEQKRLELIHDVMAPVVQKSRDLRMTHLEKERLKKQRYILGRSVILLILILIAFMVMGVIIFNEKKNAESQNVALHSLQKQQHAGITLEDPSLLSRIGIFSEHEQKLQKLEEMQRSPYLDTFCFSFDDSSSLLHYLSANDSGSILSLALNNYNLNSKIDSTNLKMKIPLMVAARFDNRTAIKHLVNARADILKGDEDKNTFLETALEFNSDSSLINIIEFLDSALTPYTSKDLYYHLNKNRIGPFHISIMNYDSLVFKYFLTNHPTLLDSGITPLSCAAGYNNIKAMNLLLNKGVKVDSVNVGDNHPPLLASSYAGSIEATKFLIKKGANVNITDKNKRTALHNAAKNGHIKLVRLLLNKGANINSQTSDRSTPINEAAYNQHWKIVELLLKKGANIHTPRADGITPLYNAAFHGNLEIIKLLIKNDAEFKDQAFKGLTPVNTASYNGHYEVVKYLVFKGANIDHPSNTHWTSINSAAFNQHWDIVKFLLARSKKETIIKATNSGTTPLYNAAYHGNLDVLKLLIKYDSNYRKPHINGWTPINAAAYGGHFEVVKYLVSVCDSESINFPENSGTTPLYNTAYHGDTQTVKLLISQGAKFKKQCINGWTPINTAAKNQHWEVVHYLASICDSESINFPEISGTTPLYNTSYHGDIQTVKLLISQGAKFKKQCINGWTPINTAAKNQHWEVVRYLASICDSESINVPEDSGTTPLYHAAHYGDSQTVKLLIKHGAEFNQKHINGWTPINTAAYQGHFDVVKLLVENGADIEIYNSNGWTPINTAADKGDFNIVKLLVDSGANIETQNKNDWTPLHSAASKGNFKIVKLLIDSGAKIDIPNKYDWTPLHSAAYSGHIKVVQLLVEHGANQGAKNNKGETALDLAKKRGFSETVTYLKQQNN